MTSDLSYFLLLQSVITIFFISDSEKKFRALSPIDIPSIDIFLISLAIAEDGKKNKSTIIRKKVGIYLWFKALRNLRINVVNARN